MYLKSVEIYGFKSFANKVRIDLNQGITTVVGPNGCGKSNVVDSIKWSIGEMSRRALRMPSMLDVIFAGTTKRQSLNMAEVTLTFDNQERKLNFDFNEVSVTRKIYRSEESEYFINKTPCRLKDIRDMFLDTGIGSDGYAIISQGEIEAILSSDALGRREFFEEVAGVSKYKAKREESLKKLEKVDGDLAVLENSLQIIDEQIRKLDAEAKKAKLQQKYREELREAEVSLIVKEISDFSAQIEAINKDLSPVSEEISQIAGAVSAQEAEHSSLNINLTEKTEEEKTALERISLIKISISKLEQGIINNRNLIEEKIKQINEIVSQEGKNLQFETEILPKYEELKVKLSQMSVSYEQMKTEYEQAQNEYSSIEKSLNDLDTNFEKQSTDIVFTYEQETKISGLISAFQSSLAHYAQNEAGLAKDIDAIKSQVASLETLTIGEKESFSKISSDLNNEMKRFDELSASKDKLIEQSKEYENLVLQLTEKTAQIKSRLDANMAQAEKDTYWIGANLIFSSPIEGVYGTLRQLIEYPQDKKPLLEDSLGRFLDSLVVKDLETAQKCLEHIKFANRGRARFIVLDRIPALEVYETLRDDVGSFINTDAQYRPLVNFLLKEVKYKDDSVYGSFWISGGAMEVNVNENYWGEVEDLKKESHIAQEELKNLKEKRDANSSAIVQTETDVAALSSKISALKIELSSLEKSLAMNSEDLEAKKQIELKFLSEREENIAKTKEAESKIQIHESELRNLKEKSESLKNDSLRIKQEKEQFSKRLLDAKENVINRKNRYDGFLNAKNSLEERIKTLETRKEELDNEKNILTERKNSLSFQIEELKTQIEDFDQKTVIERDALKDSEMLKNTLYDQIQNIRNSMERLVHNIRENKQVLSELSEKKQKFELDINTFKTRIDDSSRKLREDWQSEYEQLKEKYAGVEINMERVLFLRKRIENMGPVNMTAPEEYDALINRFNSMRSHIEDLNKAKSDLKSAIQRINETTRENFRKTFDRVQEYFRNIYSVLFNGGEANLILTDPDNLLETGVEIMAHPPGKKLINISQLSGGEKSLTALALLFSFFKVNPSPFCIMDEVDAALDEGNVERFARMIKEFSSDTQFIIITHNKRTMEIADVMYGVTMEELGVSKIISVDLKKAVDMTQSKQTAGAV